MINKKNKLKVLILGSSGLIGSTIHKYLSSKNNLIVYGTYNLNKPPFINILKYNFNEDDPDFLKQYDLIINCIGITKHNNNYSDIGLIYNLNIRLPMLLNDLAKQKKNYVIHISTDCIFSGLKGDYREDDLDYSTDFYGQSKRIAESVMRDCFIIRTSTIGHEFFFNNGLLEWFLSIKHNCKGFENAYFNGLTSLELAKIIHKYFINRLYFPKSLINIGSNKISKYELLCKFKKVYNLNINIKKDDHFKIDRTLNISKFLKLTDYKPKTWYKMIVENKYYLKNV